MNRGKGYYKLRKRNWDVHCVSRAILVVNKYHKEEYAFNYFPNFKKIYSPFFLIELIWARAMTVSIVYHLISDGKWTSQEKLVNNFQL